MTTLEQTRQRILEAAQADPRILGCVDYGSTSEGRGDEWSDLDIALFIQDSELESAPPICPLLQLVVNKKS
jgi:hypothetical protein